MDTQVKIIMGFSLLIALVGVLVLWSSTWVDDSPTTTPAAVVEAFEAHGEVEAEGHRCEQRADGRLTCYEVTSEAWSVLWPCLVFFCLVIMGIASTLIDLNKDGSVRGLIVWPPVIIIVLFVLFWVSSTERLVFDATAREVSVERLSFGGHGPIMTETRYSFDRVLGFSIDPDAGVLGVSYTADLMIGEPGVETETFELMSVSLGWRQTVQRRAVAASMLALITDATALESWRPWSSYDRPWP